MSQSLFVGFGLGFGLGLGRPGGPTTKAISRASRAMATIAASALTTTICLRVSGNPCLPNSRTPDRLPRLPDSPCLPDKPCLADNPRLDDSPRLPEGLLPRPT